MRWPRRGPTLVTRITRRDGQALMCLVLAAAGCRPSPVPTPVPAGDAASELAAVIDGYQAMTAAGASRLPDLSFAAVRRDADTALVWLARLRAIDAAGLTSGERISRALLQWEAEKIAQDTLLYWYRFDALPAISPFRVVATRVAAQPVETDVERDRYVELLEQAGGIFAQLGEKIRAQAVRGITISREQVDAVVASLRPFTEHGADSLLVVRGSRRDALSEQDRSQLDARISRVIAERIIPAARDLVAYLDGEARASAAAGVGLWQYPGGRDAYRAMVRRETTLDVTPEAIHELGVRAMAALETRMQAVRDSLGFKGTKAEFHERLRTDPQFYAATPAEVGQRLMRYADRIEPVMDRAFARRPAAPYGVRRLAPALEPSMTYGYYNWPIGSDPKGYYNFNGSDLDQRSLLMAGAISFHELVPGHHFHINLQREMTGLPPFRRNTLHAGFTEGWAEYASSVVATELGMYRDAYEVYGRLVFDAFFVARLVVDTGMNLYAWPRSRAVAYMKEHTLESDVQIDSETLRYSTRSPAQALAYRMGREVMVALRAKAEQALGARFDLTRFHDAMLANGSLPLFVLEQEIDAWLDRAGGRP